MTIRAEPNSFSNFSIITVQTLNDKSKLEINALQGELINTLLPNKQKIGLQQFRWDKKNMYGNIVNNGIYIGILTAARKQKAIKLIVQ